ncbi:MAG: hypothetical protein KatS3mg108_1986 [Isosphaeraceae bacterium]|nr:MAG: hypothetical protein KatS3mg108_1986 [Isosphaeraceae bacterium]
MAALELPADRVDLWYTRVEPWEPEESRRRFWGWLDERERATWERYRPPARKHLYLIAHALVRRVLSLYGDSIEPSEWQFAVAPGGKPEVVGPGGFAVRFNLSHTNGLAAVGVTRWRRLGVDVEAGKAPETMLALARRFFAASEVAELEGYPAAEASQIALEVWTLKEAFMKGVGLGMALSPRRFAFDVRAGRPWRLVATGLDSEQAEGWTFATALLGGVRLAVAVEGRLAEPLLVRQLGPANWDVAGNLGGWSDPPHG